MAKFNSSNIFVEDDIQLQFGNTTASPDAYIRWVSASTMVDFDVANASTIRIGETAASTLQLGGTATCSLRFGAAGQSVTSFDTSTSLGGAGSSNSAVATQLAVKTYVDSKIAGLDWQESVLDIAAPDSPPPTEVLDDRYLLANTGGAVHADWDGAAKGDIVQFNGTTWVVTYDASAEQGGAVFVEDVDIMYVHTSGTANWVTLAAGLDHGALAGLADDDHSQYALLAGRAGGQALNGGTAAGDDLTFTTTTNGTKGSYLFSELATGAAYVGAAGALLSETYLSKARGGTGIDASAVTDGQILIGNSTGNVFALATITQTANEVTVTNGSGTITLSLPDSVYLGASGELGRDADNLVVFSTDNEIRLRVNAEANSFNFSNTGLALRATTGGANRDLRFYDNDNSAYVGFVAPAAVTGSQVWTLPAADGAAGTYLQTSGAGVLTWVAVSGTVPASTMASSILRGNGSGGWVEETDFLVDGSGNLDLAGTITAGSGNTQITNAAGALQQTYNFTNNAVLTDDDAVYVALNKIDTALMTANGAKFKSGRTTIASGVATKTVTFGTAFADANYTVTAVLSNPTDATPSQYAVVVSDAIAASFTVDFSGVTDSANYLVNWIAIHD